MKRGRGYISVEVDVDVPIDQVLDCLSDDDWATILKDAPAEALAKAGLQKKVDTEPVDPLTEHLALVRATRGGAA